MKIEFALASFDSFSLGISHESYCEDENGMFAMITLGFLFFSISIMKYYE